MLDLSLDAAWAAGLLFGILRVTGFVLASPLFPQQIPITGRVAAIIALGLFLSEPLPTSPELAGLLGGATINVAVGLTLGLLTGLIFHVFGMAGGILDMSAGLGMGALVDPAMGVRSTVFSRFFTLSGLALFYVVGGLELIVRGLALSVEHIPLHGAIDPAQGLPDVAVGLSARFFVAGAELALPALAAVFLIEIALGLASRFSPQTNVFLLGLPLKVFVALLTVGVVFLAFPQTISGTMDVMRDTFLQTIRGLQPG